jgi:hypothetical protein
MDVVEETVLWDQQRVALKRALCNKTKQTN